MPKTKQIQSKALHREAVFERKAVNEEARTVELAFSSEEPVSRWFGEEILDHDPASVRLGRLRNGGPVLVDHDHTNLVGVVESVRIDSDRVGRATVRFWDKGLAADIFDQIVHGFRSKVSVGYRIHRMITEAINDDDETMRATDWEPFEISIVSVPADDSVGVGRGAGDEENSITIEYEDRSMPENTQTPAATAAPETPAPVVDVKVEREAGAAAERTRVADILTLAREHNQADLADKFIEGGRTAEDFRHVCETVAAQSEVRTETPATHLDLSEGERKSYSLMRAINAMVSNNWKEAGFERECSLAIADELGREARGIFVPFDIQSRVMNTTTGADLIATDHLAGSFIDNLRAEAVAIAAGATVLTGLVGNVDIPKKTGSATFAWLADDGDATDSDLSLGSVALSPKTIGGSVPMSRRLLKQSSPAIEALVQADLARGAALAIDNAGLQGTGTSNQPTGIVNTTGVNTQSIAAWLTTAYPTFAELVGFETAVAEDNALMGALSYVTTAAICGAMKTTAKDAGSGLFLQEGGEANGYPVRVSTQLAAKTTIFGNFNDLLIGLWGVLDVMPDTATKAASGGLVLRVFQDADIGVRHAESFCKAAA